MTKTEKLNQLFDDWENSNPLYKGKFVRDGIICEELFDKQSVKILFICKEPNNPNQTPGDFRKEWGLACPNINFSLSISEWSYGLLNNFPFYDTINNKKRSEAIKCIAFMNLKKSGGKNVSIRKEIEQHIIDNKNYLLKQIEIISPDIIIGGVTYFSHWSNLFDTNNYFKSGHGIKLLLWNDIPVIDFYHPSMRSGRSLSYALLKLVYESITKTAPSDLDLQ